MKPNKKSNKTSFLKNLPQNDPRFTFGRIRTAFAFDYFTIKVTLKTFWKLGLADLWGNGRFKCCIDPFKPNFYLSLCDLILY